MEEEISAGMRLEKWIALNFDSLLCHESAK